MTTFVDVAVGDLFIGKNGHPKFVTNYVEQHPGDHPVYSASLEKPFGRVDSFDYDADQFGGILLTWVMNGYGGRVQEISGKFSANRDRGVLLPRDGMKLPNLTYLRYAMEPVFLAAAVGRRVEGRKNDYTKIYPADAMAQMIQIPVKGGQYDYAEMEILGARLRRIEAAQAAVRIALEEVLNARVSIESLVGD